MCQTGVGRVSQRALCQTGAGARTASKSLGGGYWCPFLHPDVRVTLDRAVALSRTGVANRKQSREPQLMALAQNDCEPSTAVSHIPLATHRPSRSLGCGVGVQILTEDVVA